MGYSKRLLCRTLKTRCTLLYSARMRKRKRPESVRYSVRLSQIQSERLTVLREQIHARSDNEVFDYLVTMGTNQRDDLEQLVYSLIGDLADSLAQVPKSGDSHPASSRLDRHVHQVRAHGSPRSAAVARNRSQGAGNQNLRAGEPHRSPRVSAPEGIGCLLAR